MRSLRLWSLAAFALSMLVDHAPAFAEPYLALRQGLKCVACHVNPTGGGLRNDFGAVYAQQLMPQRPTGETPIFSGKISDLLRVGADLRASASNISIPDQDSQHGFDLDQARIYGAVTLIPQKLSLYVDELVAPGAAQTEEAYVRYDDATRGWYPVVACTRRSATSTSQRTTSRLAVSRSSVRPAALSVAFSGTRKLPFR